MGKKKSVGKLMVIVSFLVAVALFAGYGTPAAAKEVVLKALSYVPANKVEDSLAVFMMYIDRVNKAAKGELKIELIGGPEVVPVPNQVDAVSRGIADMVMTFNVHEALVPESATMALSMITPWEERKVGFFNLIDEANRKMGIKVIGRVSTDSGFYIFSKNKIDKLSDFKGIKIRSTSTYDGLFKAVGAVPVHMQMSEIFTALERGLVQAAPYPLFVYDMGIQTVAKYVLDEAFWTSHTTMTFMNLNKFNGLPRNLQEVLSRTAEQLEHDMVPVIQGMKDKEKQKLTSAGVVFVKMSPQEGDQWKRIARKERMKEIEAWKKIPPDRLETIKRMIWR